MKILILTLALIIAFAAVPCFAGGVDWDKAAVDENYARWVSQQIVMRPELDAKLKQAEEKQTKRNAILFIITLFAVGAAAR